MTVRQWFTPPLPIANTQGVRDILVLAPQSVATSIDLRTMFGGLDNGGSKLAIRADGAGLPTGAALFKAYYNVSTVPVTVNEAAVGTNSGAAWPIVDGETQIGRFIGGREVATGYATGVSPFILNYKGAAGQSGYLRIFRAADDNTDASILRMPMPSGGYAFGMPTGQPSGAWWQT